MKNIFNCGAAFDNFRIIMRDNHLRRHAINYCGERMGCDTPSWQRMLTVNDTPFVKPFTISHLEIRHHTFIYVQIPKKRIRRSVIVLVY